MLLPIVKDTEMLYLLSCRAMREKKVNLFRIITYAGMKCLEEKIF